MSAQRIASRYAKSLLDLGIERGELDQIVDDVQTVQACLQSRDLYLLIKSPIISSGKKKSIFEKLFSNLLGETVNKFFEIMLRKGRENVLPEILTSFEEQYKIYKKISTVVLKTAVPLAEEMVNEIKRRLLDSSDTRANVDLQVEVDTSLIGGFKLQFEGKEYDSSLVYKLEQMKKTIFIQSKLLKKVKSR